MTMGSGTLPIHHGMRPNGDREMESQRDERTTEFGGILLTLHRRLLAKNPA